MKGHETVSNGESYLGYKDLGELDELERCPSQRLSVVVVVYLLSPLLFPSGSPL